MEPRRTFLDKFAANTGPFTDVNDPYIIFMDQNKNYFVEIDGKEFPFEQKDYDDYKAYMLKKTIQRSRTAQSPQRSRLSPQDMMNLLEYIPRELKTIISTQEKQINNIINGPVTQEEAEWLTLVRRSIVITFLTTSECEVRVWSLGPKSFNNKYHPASMEIRYNIKNKIREYYAASEVDYAESKGILVSGSYIIKTIKENILQLDTNFNDKSKIALLDVKSVFMLLERRLTAFKFDDAVKQARQKITDYIINLSGYLGKLTIFSLQLYFWGSAISMELDVTPLSYKRGKYEDVYRDIQTKTIEYSDVVVEEINHLY